jgi:hypothetical protein
VQNLQKIDGASLFLSKTETIQGEVVGEACSLWIPKTVGGLSTRFHEKIVAPVFEMAGYEPGPALSWILRRVEGSWSTTSCVHMMYEYESNKRAGTMREQCVGMYLAGIAFVESQVGA